MYSMSWVAMQVAKSPQGKSLHGSGLQPPPQEYAAPEYPSLHSHVSLAVHLALAPQ